MAVRVGTGTGGRGIKKGPIGTRASKTSSGVRAPAGDWDAPVAGTGTRTAKNPAGYLNTSLGKGGKSRAWR